MVALTGHSESTTTNTVLANYDRLYKLQHKYKVIATDAYKYKDQTVAAQMPKPNTVPYWQYRIATIEHLTDSFCCPMIYDMLLSIDTLNNEKNDLKIGPRGVNSRRQGGRPPY